MPFLSGVEGSEDFPPILFLCSDFSFTVEMKAVLLLNYFSYKRFINGGQYVFFGAFNRVGIISLSPLLSLRTQPCFYMIVNLVLKNHAKLRGALGDVWRVALARVGTHEALRVLEESLVAGRYSRANTHLVMLLELHGDKASADFLKKLSSDERFSGRQRSAFNAA